MNQKHTRKEEGKPWVNPTWILQAELARHGILLNGEQRVTRELVEHFDKLLPIEKVKVLVDIEEEGPTGLRKHEYGVSLSLEYTHNHNCSLSTH